MILIKREIVHGENHVNEVTESASRNGIMRGMYIKKKWWPLGL